jgi:hypothetical protein
MEVGGSLNVKSLPHYAQEKYPNNRLIWGCVGPTAGLEVLGNRKFSSLPKTDPRNLQPATLQQHAHNIWQVRINISSN